jgi:hypothetical protein
MPLAATLEVLAPQNMEKNWIFKIEMRFHKS